MSRWRKLIKHQYEQGHNSIQREGNHVFRCSIVELDSNEGDLSDCRVISDGLDGGTYLEAQTAAYQ
ncbi:MAG: hypothetical protein AB7P17_12160 [Nitrospirales bacterium]|nr:hypothetical protein [Nitrospirales bacterium]